MARTLNELTEAVRSQTNELDHDFIRPNDITRWLNDAQKDLTDILQLETSVTIPLVESQDTYKIPENLNRLVRVEVDRSLYQQKSISDFKDNLQDRTYAVWGERIFLNPVPSKGSLEIFYYKKPKELIKLEDKTEIDSNHDELLIIYAIAQCYHKGQEFQQHDAYMGKYNERKIALYFHQGIDEREKHIEQKYCW